MPDQGGRPQWGSQEAAFLDEGLFVGGYQVMQYWEDALMRGLARAATVGGGRILEVGFGLGISAKHIMNYGCDEYVVIEAHPEVAEKARAWCREQRVPARVIESLWQDAVSDDLGKFDGILFDTYPTNKSELDMEQYEFVREFYPHALRLLRPGGNFTYYSDETRDIRPEHIALMLAHFDHVDLTVVSGLRPPKECDYWQFDHMIVPLLRSPRV